MQLNCFMLKNLWKWWRIIFNVCVQSFRCSGASCRRQFKLGKELSSSPDCQTHRIYSDERQELQISSYCWPYHWNNVQNKWDRASWKGKIAKHKAWFCMQSWSRAYILGFRLSSLFQSSSLWYDFCPNDITRDHYHCELHLHNCNVIVKWWCCISTSSYLILEDEDANAITNACPNSTLGFYGCVNKHDLWKSHALQTTYMKFILTGCLEFLQIMTRKLVTLTVIPLKGGQK